MDEERKLEAIRSIINLSKEEWMTPHKATKEMEKAGYTKAETLKILEELTE